MNLVKTLFKLCIIMTSGIAMTFSSLGPNETKESIDAWFVKTKSIIRSMPTYTPYVDDTWTAKKLSDTRGFEDSAAVGGVVPEGQKAIDKNAKVESILELVASHCTELSAASIKANLTSLSYIHLQARKHYGFERTARQMMQKFDSPKKT